MSFDVAADAYGRFMGRWSEPLAPLFADLVDLDAGRRVLDVGCGPGALTAVLADRYSSARVSAVDPSASFVAAARERLPDVDVRLGAAAELPYADDAFGAVVAQLVVHFMPDPVAGLEELGRVTRPGGTVAACVWDHATGLGPLASFWAGVHALDPDVRDEAGLPGSRPGHLAALFAEAGLVDIVESTLTVTLEFPDFDAWWEPFTLGVGPAGDYFVSLSPEQRAATRDSCRRLLPAAPFSLSSTAWAATGRTARWGTPRTAARA